MVLWKKSRSYIHTPSSFSHLLPPEVPWHCRYNSYPTLQHKRLQVPMWRRVAVPIIFLEHKHEFRRPYRLQFYLVMYSPSRANQTPWIYFQMTSWIDDVMNLRRQAEHVHANSTQPAVHTLITQYSIDSKTINAVKIHHSNRATSWRVGDA